ncbi:MAG: TonB-dependent receptor [Bacteroidetes bacterium]|nr:TonB-dependent receptor [Bacteroidota bacterium]
MFSFSKTFAQELSVSGVLVDEANQSIPFANVLIMDEKSSDIVAGTSSNEKGAFILKNLQPNTYLLKVTFIGYEEYIKSISITKDVILEPIVLNASAESLDEVELTAKTPTLKKEVDRLVFNVANTALSEGNMLELIRNTPGVLVLDNSITIKNTSPTVYINDKKVHLTGEELMQLLEGSSANTIKSIEVITNPPAKYDAESGAILNIIMSKNMITGYRGNVFTNYTQGVFPRYNVGMTNFYKTDKINVFANYSYNQKKINRDSNEIIDYLDNGNLDEHWDSNFNRNTWTKTHNFNLNFDYFVNENSSISFSTNILLLPYFRYLTKGFTTITDADNSLLSNFDSNNLSIDKKHNLGFDLDFVHDFNNDSKIALNAHFTTYDYNREQDVVSHYFPQNSTPFNTAFNTKANQNTSILTSQIDYDLPLNETSSFSAGVKSSVIKTESDIKQYDIINDDIIFNPNNSNAFNYDERIFAGYVGYTKDYDAFNFSAGLRVEQTNIEGNSIDTNQSNNQDYFEWFPTFNFSYQVTESTNLYVNYKRSVERPSYQDLNPFRYFLNDNTVLAGNPNLQPSFTNHYVLGTSIKDIFTIEVYYKNSDAPFIELPIQDNENNLLVYTPINLDQTIDFGLDLSAYFNVTENWSVYLVTSFYNIEDEAKFNGTVLKSNTWSNYSVFSNDWSFLEDKSLAVNFTLTYVHENQQGFQIVDTRILTDLSLKKSIFKKKGTLSLVVSDLLNEHDYTITSKYLNQNNSRYFDQDNRYIKLGFSYKFGNTKLQTNERTKEKKERERLEK